MAHHPNNISKHLAVANDTTVKRQLVICYKPNWITSNGVWLGDQPLNFSFPLLLLQVSLVFATTRTTHYLLKHFGQPRVVSQIIAGVILGPSVIGRSETIRRFMFPPTGTIVLDTLSLLSLIFFLFVIGVKTDLSMLKKSGKKAVIIGFTGTFIPFILFSCIFFPLRHSFPPDLRNGQLLFLLAARLSLTSFPVIADALDELKLLNSDLGRLVMSSTLITDFNNWILTAIITAATLASHAKSPLMGFLSVFSIIAFALFVVFVVRPATLWVVKRTPAGKQLDEGYFVGIVLVALVSAYTTEVLGYHSTLGPFVLGLALPGGMPLGATVAEKLDSFVSGLFLPLYLVLAGYRMDLSTMSNVASWGYLELVVVLCYLGKLGGSMAATLYCKMPLRDALSVGLMMNIKGIIEVSFLNNWGDSQVASAQHFSIVMLSILCITAFTTPLIKFLYKPSLRYIAYKRRTIQHSKNTDQLRILTSIHSEESVASIIDLLETSHATKENPISVFVLHLSQLVGRAAATLIPYKKNTSSPIPTPSDRIVNAFRYYELQNQGSVSVQSFVGISPYSTMHNDVCSLALDKKVTLVILPFHKQMGGAVQTARHAFQSVNRNVLDYAPCSVAILVDRGLSRGTTYTPSNYLLHRIAIYFIGGADDREGLAYGMRMVDNPNVSLTVIRFLPSAELEGVDEEGKLDDEMVNRFRQRHVGSKEVVYKEEVVQDGEGMVSIIRSMSAKFDLLIVGRRKEIESSLTNGLSMWSECPELGILGDLLASTDYEGKVSILVVQQQTRVRGSSDDTPMGITCNI